MTLVFQLFASHAGRQELSAWFFLPARARVNLQKSLSPVSPCHPKGGYFRIKTQRLTMQKSVTYEAKVRDLRRVIHWLTDTRTKKIYEKVWATMSKYEQLWIAPHHFRIFATWFRDTRRSQSAKQAKTFDGTGSSICHAIPISKLSPTTASYSKAVTSSLFGQERGLVRKVEPSLRVRKVGMAPRYSFCPLVMRLIPPYYLKLFMFLVET